jgi:hypothetical protein
MSDTALCTSLSDSHISTPGSLIANADPQEASPLFIIFPPEIRIEIFGSAVSAYGDTSKPYAFDSYCYRPGYTAAKRTDLSLLVTCKRVHEETKDLIWKDGNGNGEVAMWWELKNRVPPLPNRPELLMGVCSSYWSRIHTLHIFSNIRMFSGIAFFNAFGRRFGLQPHTVKVTIRYTDWWNWERNALLSITSIEPDSRRQWVPPSVQAFILELEAAEHKAGELEGQVQKILDSEAVWRWKRWDDAVLELDKRVGVREWEWMDTTKFNGKVFAHHPKGDRMKYIVKVLTFSVKPHSNAEQGHGR